MEGERLMHQSFKGEARASCTGFPSMWIRDLAASSGSGEFVSADTKPNLWAPLAAVSPEHFQEFPLQVSRRAFRREYHHSLPRLPPLAVRCLRWQHPGPSGDEPAMRLVRKLCQQQQIVSAEGPQ